MWAGLLISSCYSSRNTANVSKDTRGAYIAPKGGYHSGKWMSTGAFYADGTTRIGISNVYQDGSGRFKVRYLAEEQPDLGLELLRSLKMSADVDGGTTAGKPKITAEFLDSVRTSLMELTHKSNSLNLARSVLYRFNENIYNESSQENINHFMNDIVPKIVDLQKEEFKSQSKKSEDDIQIKRMELLLNLDKVIKVMKDNKMSDNDIQAIIKGVETDK